MRIVGVAAGLAFAVLLAVPSSATEPGFEKTRIPHRDASGRATIVEINPTVPGARAFVRGDERPAPGRGELSLPSSVPTPSPGRSPA
ncbi:MAG: hypothetical protein HY271_11695 [Deltaproteobacteria bacterium]|nr:hypothetical protein [Deltaproteobacteria bacterium]